MQLLNRERELEIRMLRLGDRIVREMTEARNKSEFCNFLWDNAASRKNHPEESHICGRLKSEHVGLLHLCDICNSE
jgi:hypothetical protein